MYMLTCIVVCEDLVDGAAAWYRQGARGAHPVVDLVHDYLHRLVSTSFYEVFALQILGVRIWIAWSCHNSRAGYFLTPVC